MKPRSLFRGVRKLSENFPCPAADYVQRETALALDVSGPKLATGFQPERLRDVSRIWSPGSENRDEIVSIGADPTRQMFEPPD